MVSLFKSPAENIQTAFLSVLSMPEKLTEENCHVWQFLKRFVIYVILGRVQDKRKSRVPSILSIKPGEMCSSYVFFIKHFIIYFIFLSLTSNKKVAEISVIQ